jgi:hypothetical protein
MMDKVYLGIFLAAMIALVVCGCVLTRRPTKKPPSKGQHDIKSAEPA